MNEKAILVICNRGGEDGDCGVTDCPHRMPHSSDIGGCGIGDCLSEANCVPVDGQQQELREREKDLSN